MSEDLHQNVSKVSFAGTVAHISGDPGCGFENFHVVYGSPGIGKPLMLGRAKSRSGSFFTSHSRERRGADIYRLLWSRRFVFFWPARRVRDPVGASPKINAQCHSDLKGH